MSQLTKESLADWFSDIGENEMGEKFKPSKKSTTINPFKKAFTAEHAALIAVGLQQYDSIESAEQCAYEQDSSIAEAKISAIKGDYVPELDVDKKLEGYSIYNAKSLKEAILEEIKLASEMDSYRSSINEWTEIGVFPSPEPLSTDITIYREEDDHENTLITKESLATWLWRSGQSQYAMNVFPNIEKLIKDSEVPTSLQTQKFHSTEQNSAEAKKSTKTARTPESSLMDSLGIMAWLLSEKANKFRKGDKPNASQIKLAIESVIIDLSLNENTDNKIMISNLNKDISNALSQLTDRFKP
jgi:hypothetical protein